MMFAEFLKKYFEGHAWRVQIVSTDDGADVHLVIEKEGARYGVHLSDDRDRSVGPEAIRAAIAGSETLFCGRAVVVIQSRFTGAARREAEAADPPVILIDAETMANAWKILDMPDGDPVAAQASGTFPWKKAVIAALVLLVGGGGAFIYMQPPPETLTPIAVAAATPATTPVTPPRAVAVAAAPAASISLPPSPTPQPDNTLTDEERAGGWKLLFDGFSTDGWTNSRREPVRAAISKGALNPNDTGQPLIFHKRAWGDFELAFDYMVSPGFSSGVCVHLFPLTELGGAALRNNGVEVSIADIYDGGYQAAGGIYDFVKPEKNAAKPAGQWNHMVIRCIGSIVAVELNGEAVCRMDQDEWRLPGLRPDGSKHRLNTIALRIRVRVGYISLPNPGKAAWFKNIKLRELKKG